MSAFDVTARDGAARAGVLKTAHGDVFTPVFMPVGTKATVKSLAPDELRSVGAQIVLGNSYHLHFRPGDALIAEQGGLHRFMAWEGPILTDSGGFQVFSLRDTLLAVDDDGVTFRSVYDGSRARLSALDSARIQANLGSDIAMCLDICPAAGVSRRDLEDAVRRPTTWARAGEGRLNLRNARVARDPRPADDGCPGPACERFSRAYLRHLVNQQELLGLRLLSLHNLRFLLDLTAGARQAIERGELSRYK